MWEKILKSDRSVARMERREKEQHKAKLDEVLSEDVADVLRALYKAAALLDGATSNFKIHYDLVDFLTDIEVKLWDRLAKEEEGLERRAEKAGLDPDTIIEQLEGRWRD